MKIFTIGYSGFEREEFARELDLHGVRALIDVRSTPYSEHSPEYNKPALESFMASVGKYYRSYAREFGARQEDRAFYSPEGYLDFELFAKSEQFTCGVKRLCDAMAKGWTFALMCVEKHPIDCHRAILVSRAFHELGLEVVHLMPEGTLTQNELEELMLGSESRQGNLFMTRDELVREAYRDVNRRIGWRGVMPETT